MSKIAYPAVVLSVFLLAMFRNFDQSRKLSQTYDEACHLVSGYAFLKGNPTLNIEQPPFAKVIATIPLRFFPLKDLPIKDARNGVDVWRLGKEFLYENIIPFYKILTVARITLSIFYLFLGALIAHWTNKVAGNAAALLSLIFWFCEPNLVGHSIMIQMDFMMAFFTTLFVYLLWNFTATFKQAVLLGFVFGLALLTKHSTIAIFLPILFFHFLYIFLNGKIDTIAHSVLWTLIFLFTAILLVGLFYNFEISTYIQGFLFQLKHSSAGHASYFWGTLSQGGQKLYYLAAFLLKTQIAFLFLFLIALYRYFKILYHKNINQSILSSFLFSTRSSKEFFYLLCPLLWIFLLHSLFSNINIGLRYILMIYPLLILFTSFQLAPLWQKKTRASTAILSLGLAFCIIESIHTHPNYISYFNQFIGRSQNAYQFLADSNLDWGQDLPALKRAMAEQNIPRIFLAYFGTASPDAYEINYEGLPTLNLLEIKDQPLSKNQIPDFVAISVNSLLDIYHENRFRWIRANRKPIQIAGKSIFMYPLKDDPELLKQIAEIYDRTGFPMRAESLMKITKKL